MATVDVFILWGLALVTVVVALATLLPMLRHPHWIIRGFDFPRLQLAVVALVVLILQLALLDLDRPLSWFLVTATAFSLGCQLWWILPYTVLWPREVKAARRGDPDRTITILTSNVLTPNRNAGALISLVEKHQPDVLVTLESDQWWEDQLSVLKSRMPYTIQCPLDNLYGMNGCSRCAAGGVGMPLPDRRRGAVHTRAGGAAFRRKGPDSFSASGTAKPDRKSGIGRTGRGTGNCRSQCC